MINKLKLMKAKTEAKIEALEEKIEALEDEKEVLENKRDVLDELIAEEEADELPEFESVLD